MEIELRRANVDNFDLDNVIENTRKCIINTENIDISNKYDEITIGLIMNRIDELSKKIIENNEPIKSKKQVYAKSNNNTNLIEILKKVDKLFKNFPFYKNTLRPVLREKINNRYNRKIIDGRELLKFDYDVFVDVLYRSILFREADQEGMSNALQHVGDLSSKIDLMVNIAKSDEAKALNIKIKGIKSLRVLLYVKYLAYRIPIIGYLIKIIVNLIFLPKKVIQLQNMNKNLDNKIQKLNAHVEQLHAFDMQINLLDLKIDETNQYVTNEIALKEQLFKKEKIEKEIMDKFYLRYNEVLMPDSRDEVKNRAKVYIDKLNNLFIDKEKEKLVSIDLGCGECEWIELLKENGYTTIGVDNNTFVVRKVKSLFPDFSITQNDALSYLRGLKDNSVDLLTSFHMVEHLEMMELIELLSECNRVLKKSGVIIVETPNPQNIFTSTYYFNMDPTHKKPLPPELLAFFISESGLYVKERILLYPLNFIPYEYNGEDPIKNIIFRFNMEQAYSILAVKE